MVDSSKSGLKIGLYYDKWLLVRQHLRWDALPIQVSTNLMYFDVRLDYIRLEFE